MTGWAYSRRRFCKTCCSKSNGRMCKEGHRARTTGRWFFGGNGGTLKIYQFSCSHGEEKTC